MRLHLRLALPLFGAAFAVSVVGAAGVHRLVERVFAAALDQQAGQVARIAEDELRSEAERLREDAAILAVLDGPVAARVADWGRVRAHAVLLAGPGGTPRSTWGAAMEPADVRAAAATPDGSPRLVRVPGGGLLVVAAVPDRLGGGALLAGRRLDGGFARRVAGLARASIEISVEGRAVAGADPGGTDPGEATATVAIELPTAAETPVRLTARVPAGRILAARRAALGATVAGGVLLFLAGAGVALWTLARVTRPLRSLAAAAEALAAGGAPVEVPAGAPAEVGVLVARFNEMGGKLAESRDRLVHTAQLSTVGQLVAGVSHELNNPLTILLTHAEYALARLDPAAPGRAEVATVLDQGRRLARLLGELRGLVRPGDAAPAPLDLNDIARETAALIRHDAAKASVACEAVVARAPVIVRASADQIRQAALNLALNALQATPAGGRMAVRAESGAPGGRLVVEDTGPGFPPDLRDRLGEPFVSTRPGRLGLGLAITRDVAARHGGRLRLDAAPGGGARATLELPA